jgi:hypothetical protein
MAKRVRAGPLTKEEIEEFHEFLNDEERFEKMVDRAVRGMSGDFPRPKRASRAA